jgi:flagellar hook protein FlgE
MSFYTALTGLNGAQSDISATSNNIANVGTTGFKRSRAEFGDIFATSPLQNSSSSIGSGAILKGIKQQFTQGNIASSLNALDLAISGQGFFALKPSLTSSQTVYTRNGSFNIDNDRYVVDSSGQYLMTYPVNTDGSVTAKDLDSAVPLKLPVTSGEPKSTSNINLGVNVPADAPVVTSLPKFKNGYAFNPSDAESYTNSTSITIFDDLGNPTIATIYFIKTQNASASDPTNKYDTRLVINGSVIDPDLVSAVNDSGSQIFVDRFGNQTTRVADTKFSLEGKGSPLYKLDDLRTKVNSQPASIQGEQAGFDFGAEGDKLIEIVTDPLMFTATEEGGNTSSGIFWGKDFLLVNVDDSDAPVSIDLRPGKYNATQLAAEVERAINEAYGDDKKFQIVQNVDDELTIDLFKLGADGSPVSLGANKITVDLLKETSVSELAGIAIDGASPDFSKDEFLVHVQQRINATLNEYVDPDGNNGAEALGVDGRLFTKVVGAKIETLPISPAIIQIDHNTGTDGIAAASETKFLAYSNFGKKPSLAVFDGRTLLTNDDGDNDPLTKSPILTYDPMETKITLYVLTSEYKPKSATIQLQGPTTGQFGALLNGRTLRLIDSAGVPEGDYTKIQIDASGLALSETAFSLDSSAGTINLLFNPSSNVEAFFEGANNGTEGVFTTFNSSKIALREIGTDAKRTTESSSYKHAFVISKSKADAAQLTSVDALGLGNLIYDATDPTTIANINSVNKLNWVDETNPAIKVSYDGMNQRLQFSVDRAVLGTGTGSNFNSFTVYGSSIAIDTNNLGIPDSGNSTEVLIRGGEILSTESFVADGEEVQLNDKRYGVTVAYKSDTKSFVISSGTTGENIDENGAIGVSDPQKASNIQVGRRTLNSDGTVDTSETINPNNRVIGGGENSVFGFGVTKTDYLFSAGRGLAAQAAIATGRAAQGDLTNVFRLTGNGGENIFNIAVNGISGVIEIPAGNYVGTTLASTLEERINQISDPLTGAGVGGVTVRYSAATNSFTFTTGTTGDASTIKVKGSSRLGLDDVPLGVGAIPQIYNLVQAKNSSGEALFVDPEGNVVTTPPSKMVSGYYPLYIDEGELTFDKTGKLVSPKNMVSFEQQGEGFSISLAVDFSASTQYAQPFSVLSVEQDGFTSGRLDGLEIDSSGTIRANYTNGQNNPLGKIVVATFNNQNGLKQVGNATYVETAVSGSAQVGEAGSEGFGSVQSGSLERSNVDITEELVNLITAQRNFQAAAKAIETTTTLTQTIINIRM